MSEFDVCSICGKELAGSLISTGRHSFAHPHCWHRQNPPTKAVSLYQVARNGHDPLLAAELIADIVPNDIAQQIVSKFNARIAADHERRCAEP